MYGLLDKVVPSNSLEKFSIISVVSPRMFIPFIRKYSMIPFFLTIIATLSIAIADNYRNPSSQRHTTAINNWQAQPAEQVAVSRNLLATADGYWSTNGSKIVDSEGNEVYFSGVNWGGFESENCVVHGLWGGTGRTYQSHLNQMIANGFNLIRLAFAGTCVQPDVFPLPTAVDYNVSSELLGLTSLEILQKIVEGAGKVGIRVILDYHRIRPTTNDGAPEDGLWYDSTYPVTYWLNTWKNLTTLFKGNPTVVGVDLFNEPHQSFLGTHEGPFWSSDDSDPFNWRAAAKKAADVIQSIEPGLLICVQGMWMNAWWGGNLQPMKDLPLVLTVPHKLVYQIHDYGPIVSDQPWFNAPEFPQNLPSVWGSLWGFVHIDDLAPVWVGEFGTKHNTTYVDRYSGDFVALTNWKELAWFQTFCKYIEKHNLVWTWFTWGPNSRDTGGMLQDDWTTIHEDKLLAVTPLLYPSFTLKVIANSSTPTMSSPPPPPSSTSPKPPSNPPPWHFPSTTTKTPPSQPSFFPPTSSPPSSPTPSPPTLPTSSPPSLPKISPHVYRKIPPREFVHPPPMLSILSSPNASINPPPVSPINQVSILSTVPPPTTMASPPPLGVSIATPLGLIINPPFDYAVSPPTLVSTSTSLSDGGLNTSFGVHLSHGLHVARLLLFGIAMLEVLFW